MTYLLSEEQSVLLFQSVREPDEYRETWGRLRRRFPVTQADEYCAFVCRIAVWVVTSVRGGQAGTRLWSVQYSRAHEGSWRGVRYAISPGEGTTAILQLPVVQPGPTADEAVAETGVAAVSHAVVSEGRTGVPKPPQLPRSSPLPRSGSVGRRPSNVAPGSADHRERTSRPRGRW